MSNAQPNEAPSGKIFSVAPTTPMRAFKYAGKPSCSGPEGLQTAAEDAVKWRKPSVLGAPTPVLVIMAGNAACFANIVPAKGAELRITYGPGLPTISDDGLEIMVCARVSGDDAFRPLYQDFVKTGDHWKDAWVSLPETNAALEIMIGCGAGPKGDPTADWLALAEIVVADCKSYVLHRAHATNEVRTFTGTGLARLHVNHPSMQKIADAIVAETDHYSGGPLRDFECVGRDGFVHLLMQGLLPHHKVLDFGCGSLRLAYWLIRFLDPDRYFGIEPEEKCVVAGLRFAVGDELARQKRPKFMFIDNCDMTAFEETFNYVIARSILTHTAPGMLALILKKFAAAATPDGVFLASYWRRDGDYLIKAPPGQVVETGDDLPEDDGRFVEFIKFSFPYMQQAAAEAGLVAEELLDLRPVNEQVWLKFTKKE